MSECITHQWYAPNGTLARIQPPCPWCQISKLRKQVKSLKAAGKGILELYEPIETSNAYPEWKALKDAVENDKAN